MTPLHTAVVASEETSNVTPTRLSWDRWFFPSAVWLAQLVCVLIVVFVAGHVLQHGPLSKQQPFDAWFRGFAAWDGGWYLGIARHGYPELQHTAFFPLYPLLICYASALLGWHPVTVGFWISNLSFLAALHVLYRLAAELFDERVAQRAILLIAVYPMALFYHAVYSESLTLLATSLFFYLMVKDRWFAAILVVAIASAGKQLTVVLGLVALIYLVRSYRKLPRRQWVLRLLSLPLVPAGLFVYMGFLWYRHGNPLAFIEAQQGWYRQTMIPVYSIFAVWHRVYASAQLSVGDWNYAVIQWVNGALTLIFYAVAGWGLIARRASLSPGMLPFSLIILALATTSGSGDLNSYARQFNVLFPLFFLAAALLGNRAVFSAVLLVSFTLKVLLLAMFANGYWVT
jgi:hypothetical protein